MSLASIFMFIYRFKSCQSVSICVSQNADCSRFGTRIDHYVEPDCTYNEFYRNVQNPPVLNVYIGDVGTSKTAQIYWYEGYIAEMTITGPGKLVKANMYGKSNTILVNHLTVNNVSLHICQTAKVSSLFLQTDSYLDFKDAQLTAESVDVYSPSQISNFYQFKTANFHIRPFTALELPYYQWNVPKMFSMESQITLYLSDKDARLDLTFSGYDLFVGSKKVLSASFSSLMIMNIQVEQNLCCTATTIQDIYLSEVKFLFELMPNSHFTFCGQINELFIHAVQTKQYVFDLIYKSTNPTVLINSTYFPFVTSLKDTATILATSGTTIHKFQSYKAGTDLYLRFLELSSCVIEEVTLFGAIMTVQCDLANISVERLEQIGMQKPASLVLYTTDTYIATNTHLGANTMMCIKSQVYFPWNTLVTSNFSKEELPGLYHIDNAVTFDTADYSLHFQLNYIGAVSELSDCVVRYYTPSSYFLASTPSILEHTHSNIFVEGASSDTFTVTQLGTKALQIVGNIPPEYFVNPCYCIFRNSPANCPPKAMRIQSYDSHSLSFQRPGLVMADIKSVHVDVVEDISSKSPLILKDFPLPTKFKLRGHKPLTNVTIDLQKSYTNYFNTLKLENIRLRANSVAYVYILDIEQPKHETILEEGAEISMYQYKAGYFAQAEDFIQKCFEGPLFVINESANFYTNMYRDILVQVGDKGYSLEDSRSRFFFTHRDSKLNLKIMGEPPRLNTKPNTVFRLVNESTPCNDVFISCTSSVCSCQFQITNSNLTIHHHTSHVHIEGTRLLTYDKNKVVLCTNEVVEQINVAGNYTITKDVAEKVLNINQMTVEPKSFVSLQSTVIKESLNIQEGSTVILMNDFSVAQLNIKDGGRVIGTSLTGKMTQPKFLVLSAGLPPGTPIICGKSFYLSEWNLSKLNYDLEVASQYIEAGDVKGVIPCVITKNSQQTKGNNSTLLMAIFIPIGAVIVVAIGVFIYLWHINQVEVEDGDMQKFAQLNSPYI